MTSRDLTLTVGRYEVTGTYRAVLLEHDGSYGIPSEELGRLELQSAAAVLGTAPRILGGELRFARKALGIVVADLANALDVRTETLIAWENDAEPIPRQTQLAVLFYLERAIARGKLDEPLTFPPGTYTVVRVDAPA